MKRRSALKFGLSLGLATCALLVVVGSAGAQTGPKDAIGARVNGYRETGAAFKTINDQLKNDAPAKIMLRVSAKRLVQTANEQYGWFPLGSGAETGAKTKAKPAVWSDAAAFKAAQDRFKKEAELMSLAVESGDADAMKKQARALGATCQACHSKFRGGD